MVVRIIVSGKVQGVFFRQSAKKEADKLGLVGWVRNDADGSVEALVVGSKEKLDQFIAWCKNGSPAAKVGKVEEQWADRDEEANSFEIR